MEQGQVQSQPSPTEIGTKEKIHILLAEYSTLRAEILQRNSVMNQFMTASITATIAIVGFIVASSAYFVAAFVGIALCLVIAAVGRLITFDTMNAARHVRGLEVRINTLAGDRLLEWESDHGIEKVGIGPRLLFWKRKKDPILSLPVAPGS